MSPRPRTVEDAEIFAATARAVGRLGPVRLTLADVAREAGLTAAALVHRFGSRRGLLLAFVQQGPSMVDDCFVAVRATHASPLAALVAAATDMAEHVRSPDELVNSLAFLQIDLTDPDFRNWAIHREGRVAAFVRRDLETLLRPLRPTERAVRPSRRAGRRALPDRAAALRAR
jgi:AcrR family transcriptional regulator